MKRLTKAILHMAAMWDFQPILQIGLEAAGTDEICLQGQDSGHTPGNSACGLRSLEYACFGLVWHWLDILRGRIQKKSDEVGMTLTMRQVCTTASRS